MTDLQLPAITDEFMRERLSQARDYTLVVLNRTAAYKPGDADPVVWEHVRRNMALEAWGVMPIVCPVRDDTDVAGIAIFTLPPDQVSEVMADDPGVKAGIFSFDAHPISGFPGSALPPQP